MEHGRARQRKLMRKPCGCTRRFDRALGRPASAGVPTDSSKRECRFYQWETLKVQGSESFSGLAKMRRSTNPVQLLHAVASIMAGLLPRLSVTGGPRYRSLLYSLAPAASGGGGHENVRAFEDPSTV